MRRRHSQIGRAMQQVAIKALVSCDRAASLTRATLGAEGVPLDDCDRRAADLSATMPTPDVSATLGLVELGRAC